MNIFGNIVHAVGVFFGRRSIASAISGFETAHKKLSQGVQLLEDAKTRTEALRDKAATDFHAAVDAARQVWQQLDVKHTGAIDTLEAEAAKAARVAERFKQFIEG